VEKPKGVADFVSDNMKFDVGKRVMEKGSETRRNLVF